MSNKIKIQSTCMPKSKLGVNEWCEIYKVGSRVPKFHKENNAPFLNSQYDFSKLSQPTVKIGFIDKVKNVILADLW